MPPKQKNLKTVPKAQSFLRNSVEAIPAPMWYKKFEEIPEILDYLAGQVTDDQPTSGRLNTAIRRHLTPTVDKASGTKPRLTRPSRYLIQAYRIMVVSPLSNKWVDILFNNNWQDVLVWAGRQKKGETPRDFYLRECQSMHPTAAHIDQMPLEARKIREQYLNLQVTAVGNRIEFVLPDVTTIPALPIKRKESTIPDNTVVAKRQNVSAQPQLEQSDDDQQYDNIRGTSHAARLDLHDEIIAGLVDQITNLKVEMEEMQKVVGM